jgi:hypothetical protein
MTSQDASKSSKKAVRQASTVSLQAKQQANKTIDLQAN